MRYLGSPQLCSILLLFFTTFTIAWPWPNWLPARDSLIVRQDSSTTAAKQTSTQASASPSATATDNKSKSDSDSSTAGLSGSQSATGTDSQTGTITKSPSSSDSSDSSAAASSTGPTTFDATYPAGGISLLSPAATSTTYIKIGDNVTFAWNFTSLQATPTAVDVMATCLANDQLYTIAMNQSVGANSTQEVVWDTGAYQATAVSDPLLTQTYTLIIYDAASSISATAQAGYLSVYDQYVFGMYVPQPYKDLNGWICATCSGALGENERRMLGMAVGVAALTVLSFGWFVNGLGILW